MVNELVEINEIFGSSTVYVSRSVKTAEISAGLQFKPQSYNS